VIFFHQWQNFFAGCSLETLDLANKLRILLLVKDFANHAKFLFSWPAWAVYSLHLQQKDQDNYMAINRVEKNPVFFFKKQDSVLFSRRIEKPHSELFLSHHAISPFSESYNNYKLCLQLKAIVFLYAFEESVNCALLSFFCDDSNLHISLFKYVLSTMGVSKESISKFLIGNRFHVKLRILSPSDYGIQKWG